MHAVDGQSPDPESIKVIPGPSHLLIDWNTDDGEEDGGGWQKTHTIKIVPKADERRNEIGGGILFGITKFQCFTSLFMFRV